MKIKTRKYLKKPIYVDAVKVSSSNFNDIAEWCQGEILFDKEAGESYIKVRVHMPQNPKQTKAFVGDWVLYTDRGYKVYTNKAFWGSFEKAQEESETITEVEAASSEEASSAIQKDQTQELAEQLVNDPESGVDEVVAATPENIAQAVMENEKARALEPDDAREAMGLDRLSKEEHPYPEEHTTGGTPREEINVGLPEEELTGPGTQPEDLDTSDSFAEEATPLPENAVETMPPQETVVPEVIDGKRVLSLEEQGTMDAEELKQLIQAGEVVLVQDLA